MPPLPHRVHGSPFLGAHSPSYCPSFRLPLTLPSDPVHSGWITQSVYCSSTFCSLPHFDIFVHVVFIPWNACLHLSSGAAPTSSSRLSLPAVWSLRTLSLCPPLARAHHMCPALHAQESLSTPFLCPLSHSVFSLPW